MKTTQLTDIQVSKLIPHLEITFFNGYANATYEDKALYIDIQFDLGLDQVTQETIEQFDDPATIDSKQLSWIIQAIKNKEQEKNHSEQQNKVLTQEFYDDIANNIYFLK